MTAFKPNLLPKWQRASLRRALLALVLLIPAACSTYSNRTAPFRHDYWSHQFTSANERIAELYASEAGVSGERVLASKGLDDGLQPDTTDEALLLMEMALTQLALGEPGVARDLLLRCRDVLDDSLRTNTAATIAQNVAASLSDDNALSHTPFDYDHIMLRVMLCLCELVADGRDARAYAFQIGEIQDRILGTPLEFTWSDGSYDPRSRYQRLGAGAYLEGVVYDVAGNADAANGAYRRFLQLEPNLPIRPEVEARIADAVYAEAGHGVLHVFYLGGRGPTLIEGEEDVTASALKIAGIITALATSTAAPAFQKPTITVPVVAINDDHIPELHIQAGSKEAFSKELLDVNDVAIAQIQANMPVIMGRAIARRVVKAAVAAGVEHGIRNSGDGRDSGSYVAGAVVGALVSAIWTSAEGADTRIWSTLPSRIETARLELPEGIQEVTLDGRYTTPVRIARGQQSFMLVIRPDTSRSPTIIVDRFSRVAPPEDPPPPANPTR